MPARPGHLRPHEERPNYARREPEEPLPGEPRLGDSFLIVTEGEVTERMYFGSPDKVAVDLFAEGGNAALVRADAWRLNAG